MKQYNIIYADPPWEYKESGTGLRGTADLDKRYKGVMTIQDICDLSIKEISDNNCILWLWVTFPRLEQGLKVIKEWGFKYYGLGFNWIKMNKKNKLTIFWGMGYYTRQNSEICLIGMKGKLKPLVRNIHSVIHYPVMHHSKKPDMIKDKIVNIIGDLPRIELFAREKTDGWDVWGNEVESDIEINKLKELNNVTTR